MKSIKHKSHAHKEDNSFKFETFNEKLNKINISLVNNLKRRFASLENNEDDSISFFATALEKWNDLNCTYDFQQLKKKIGSPLDIQNLIQIIHKKKFLFNILLEEMERTDNKAMDAILELIIALVRDLHSEFYEYFPLIFDRLVCLSMTNDNPEIIENIFVCQTFLFKYLWKFILKDIDQHYVIFKKALTCNKKYVIHFTSEIFSFLLRRSKEPESVFKIIFESVEQDKHLSLAVGRIIFETVKGLNGNMNNKAKIYLKICFNQFVTSNGSWILEPMKHFINYSLNNFQQETFIIIWKFLLIDCNNQFKSDNLRNMFELFYQIVEYKKCKYVSDSLNLLLICGTCLFDQVIDEETKKRLLQIIEKLFIFKYEDLTSDKMDSFCENFFSINNQKLSLIDLFNFATKIVSSPIYDKILYKYLNKLFFQILSLKTKENQLIAIEYMSYVILQKRPRPSFGREIQMIYHYLLEFEENQFVVEKLCQLITESEENFSVIYCCIVILSSLPSQYLYDFIRINILNVIEPHLLKKNETYESRNIFTKLLFETIIFFIAQKGHNSSINEINIEKFIIFLTANPYCLEILQAFDIFVNYNKSLSKEFVQDLTNSIPKIYSFLESNLASPIRMNRIVSLNILCSLDLNLVPQEENPKGLTIFKICFEVESVMVDLANYRERLRYLRKLDCNFISFYTPEPLNEIRFDMASVHFLLGTLYENLSVLWNPILEILETYAKCSNEGKSERTNRLLNILFNHFEQTLQYIKMSKSNNNQSNEFSLRKLIAVDLISRSDISNFDHLNHRIWLLKSFKNFPNIIERRNTQFVNLFFSFLSEEFNHHRSINIFHGLIDIETKSESESDTKNSKISWKTFFAFLEIFEKFKNPKALNKEPALHQLYMNLLSSPNFLLQRHAINCLLTYNQSYLTKYKENFFRLIDDKSFTFEINSFMIHDNIDDNVIAPEDRSNIVPLFLRILIGKMLASSGTKTHGKSKIDFKRSLIFKVLASFDENTQIMFMDLIFSSLNQLMKTDYETLQMEDVCKIIHNSIKSESLIRTNILSFITTLEFLMKHFGNASMSVMKYMFKVLIICSMFCSNVLSSDCRSKFNNFEIDSMKTFRTNCFKVAQYFFSNFHYDFSSIEIDLLFESLVKPLISNLYLESQNYPSPLLRLFYAWSENPNYFILLIKLVEKNDSITPISSIIQLYSNPKLLPVTILFITKFIENLLTADSKPELIKKIEINNFGHPIANCDQYPKLNNDNINFGALILISYIKNIIERIKLNYSKKINSKFAITLQEVNILARLSLYVNDPEDSKTIMILLLHSISQKKRPEEDKEIFILKILNHLSNNIADEKFWEILDCTYNLFMLVEKPLPRKELCIFLLNLCKKNSLFISVAQLINDLNSFNPRFPEEPDYDRRILAFKNISGNLESLKPLSKEFMVSVQLLFLNCAFFITTYDDLSLKELSTQTIIKLSQFFRNSPSRTFEEYIVELVLFKIVSKGIRNKKESISNEFINILIEIIQMFPSKNIFIDQLLSLCHEDEEMDFWQNIKHIQLHRRARALNRLMQNKELLSSISSRVYLNILLPIVNNFISNNNNNITLFNASVDSLATFLQYCSWAKYDNILSHYVNGLLFNKIDAKISIRIISTLLEKFSFLKPEQVSLIEKTLHQDDFDKITSEYSFDIENKNTKKVSTSINKLRKKNQKFKKHKLKQTLNVDDEKKCEKQFEVSEKPSSEIFQNDLRYYQKIYDSLCRKLLPLLHKCLHQKSQMENVHDYNKYEDDEDIQTIPISIAIIKLLKHVQLDQRLFEINLNSITLRLCQFLQSKLYSIRETARKTLTQILDQLGPKYFSNIFYEMKILLNRGYQRHVFTYTISILLQRLTPQLNGGDLDHCMLDIIDVCHLELFGSLSEEKEVSQIITKTKEAKKIKSYDIYEILARFVSESRMETIMNPLKMIMKDVNDHKTMKKIEKAFHKIACGLVRNAHISIKVLMKFLNEIFVSTLTTEKTDKQENVEIRKFDSFIIPEKSLRRVNQVSKLNHQSHSHILINFALNCYIFILKNQKSIRTDEFQDILNQTLSYLEQFLKSNDLKVVTSSLNCILLLLKKFSALISFQNYSQSIILEIFSLLKKHSGLKHENNQLTVLCFKTIVHFINIRSECQLNDEQIAILLSYAEYDIENNKQNVSVYFLLKSIITRRFISKEVHILMERLVVLALTTEIDLVRDHASELYIKYLLDYPIDPGRLKGKLLYLVKQLEVDWMIGRKTSITILKAVIQNLPFDVLIPLKYSLLKSLSLRVLKEEEPECRIIVEETILKFFSKLNSKDLDEFFNNFVLPLSNSNEISNQYLASRICILFLEYEKKDFEKRIPFCIQQINEQLDPKRFKSLLPFFECQDVINCEDNLICIHLNFIFKILKMENIHHILNNDKYKKFFDNIFSNIISTYLLHQHISIRAVSIRIFGQIFSLFDPQSFIDNSGNFFMFQNSREKMIELSRKFCYTFRYIYLCQFIDEQLIKNLVYIATVFILWDFENQLENSLLKWLIKRMLFEVALEIKQDSKKTKKRIWFVKWIAAICLKLGPERIHQYLSYFFPSLCRENISSLNNNVYESDPGKDELKNLIKQVFQMIRNMIGSEEFIDLYNKTRNRISQQRLERRKMRAAQMITHMDVAVKRKLRKHKRSQNSKRRRISNFNVSSF